MWNIMLRSFDICLNIFSYFISSSYNNFVYIFRLWQNPGQYKAPFQQQQQYHQPYQQYNTGGYPPLPGQGQGPFNRGPSYGQNQDLGFKYVGQGQDNVNKSRTQRGPVIFDDDDDDTDGVSESTYNKNPRRQHEGQGHPQYTPHKQKFPRSEEETQALLEQLRAVFPDPSQEETLRKVLANHTSEKEISKLTNYCMNVLF